MKICVNNTRLTICHECLTHFPQKSLYLFNFLGQFQDRNNILCKKCLFKLLLGLNDIFELFPLLDGTSECAKDWRLTNEIPPSVMTYLMKGRKIAAIKEYRVICGKYPDDDFDKTHVTTDYSGKTTGYYKISLKEAKDKIDGWWDQLNCSTVYRHDNIDPWTT